MEKTGEVVARRWKNEGAVIVIVWIILPALGVLIGVLWAGAEDMQEQLTGLLYSVFLIILFGALIFRTILYFVIPQIYIVYKDDKFYLYPKKKTEIVLYPGEIKDVIRRHYKGRRYSRYAHRSGKLTIVHARGTEEFSLVDELEFTCRKIEEIRDACRNGACSAEKYNPQN